MADTPFGKLGAILSTSLSVDSSPASEEAVIEHSKDQSPEHTEQSLLTGEERILKLLGAHDGRLWQADIAAETGFFESKTSRLLCEVEDDGKIERNRVGRQKFVDLADSDE